MNHAQDMQHHHDNPPAAFNPSYRHGLGEALSKAHAEWCEQNPDVTRTERAAAYKATSERLAPNFPSVREMQAHTTNRDNLNETLYQTRKALVAIGATRAHKSKNGESWTLPNMETTQAKFDTFDAIRRNCAFNTQLTGYKIEGGFFIDYTQANPHHA